MVDFNCACVISRGRGWKVRRLLQPTKVTIAIEANEGSNIRPSTSFFSLRAYLQGKIPLVTSRAKKATCNKVVGYLPCFVHGWM